MNSDNQTIENFYRRVNKENKANGRTNKAVDHSHPKAMHAEAKLINDYEAKMGFAKILHSQGKMTTQQLQAAQAGLKGQLALNIAENDMSMNKYSKNADAQLNSHLQSEMTWLNVKPWSLHGNQTSKAVTKYYQHYAKAQKAEQQVDDARFMSAHFHNGNLSPDDKLYIKLFHHEHNHLENRLAKKYGNHNFDYDDRGSMDRNADKIAQDNYRAQKGSFYDNSKVIKKLDPFYVDAQEEQSTNTKEHTTDQQQARQNSSEQESAQGRDDHMENNTNDMNWKREDKRVKLAFKHLYHDSSEFHNQVNLYLESQKDRQLKPIITPHVSNDMVKLHDGSMATHQTRRIYKDYSNQASLADYRAALANYIYTKDAGIPLNHAPGETDVDPNPNDVHPTKEDMNIIQNESDHVDEKQSQAAQQNHDNEFYVNNARVDPFWTHKMHRPYVKVDAVHRTDINSHSPLAGHHVVTYIDKNGNMHHSQIIPGQVYNNILRMNGRQPYSVGDFVHSIGHNIATAATKLVFRAKTFISRGLRKIRGKFSHFINVASIKASRFKLNLQREINLERVRHRRHILMEKARVASRAKHPYDAFNVMSPREMREAFGDNPKNYHWKQDFEQTRKRNSIFNRFTPEHLDKVNGPSWRPGYHQTFNRGFGNSRQQGDSFEM